MFGLIRALLRRDAAIRVSAIVTTHGQAVAFVTKKLRHAALVSHHARREDQATRSLLSD